MRCDDKQRLALPIAGLHHEPVVARFEGGREGHPNGGERLVLERAAAAAHRFAPVECRLFTGR